MGWWKTAKPGDKVVFCDKGPNEWVSTDEIAEMAPDPIYGHVYTVVVVAPFSWANSGFHVLLKELSSRVHYDAGMFRPVQTKSTETGMAILRKLLAGNRARQRA